MMRSWLKESKAVNLIYKEEIIMPVFEKINNEKSKDNAVVNSKVKSHADDPYFVKKAEEAKEILNRVGLPLPNKK